MRTNLQRRLPIGSVVNVTQRHVNRAGTMRWLSLSITRRGRQVDITRQAAEVLGEKVAYRDGQPTIKVGGCGMDMHFHLVYSFARRLRPNGHRCVGEGCPSNDHFNDYGRLGREYDAVNECGPTYEERSAYVAARQEWIAAQDTYNRGRRHADSGYTLKHRTI